MLGIEVDLALVISWPGNASRRVVGSVAFATGVFEDRAEQTHRARRSARAAGYDRAASFGFHVRGRLTRSHVADEPAQIGGG